MSPTGEIHRRASSLDRCNHLAVAHRAPRLHDSRDAGGQQDLRTVREGKEGVGGSDGTRSTLPRPLHRQPTGVDAVHLAHPDSYRSAVPCEQDRVRLHRTSRLPGELEIRQRVFGAGLTGSQLPIDRSVVIRVNCVGKLDQKPSIDPPALSTTTRGRLDHQDAEVLLGGEHIDRPVGVPRRDDHLGEDLRDLSCHLQH